MSATKVCKNCLLALPIDSFQLCSNKRNDRTYRRNICKQCYYQRAAARYHEGNPPKAKPQKDSKVKNVHNRTATSGWSVYARQPARPVFDWSRLWGGVVAPEEPSGEGATLYLWLAHRRVKRGRHDQ